MATLQMTTLSLGEASSPQAPSCRLWSQDSNPGSWIAEFTLYNWFPRFSMTRTLKKFIEIDLIILLGLVEKVDNGKGYYEGNCTFKLISI